MTEQPVAAGKSSFDLIDKETAFEIIDLRQDSTFLDLACGIGKYSVEIARMIGVNGTVYAVDLWQEGIEALRQEIGKRKMKNVKTLLADITKELPLKEGSIDACLMATILHDLSRDAQGSALREVGRLLNSGGMLRVIEFKKIH